MALVCSIQHAVGTSRRTGLPYDSYVLHCLSRRPNVGLVTDTIWISEAELKRSGVMVGDQVRAYRDGGIDVLSGSSVHDLGSVLDQII